MDGLKPGCEREADGLLRGGKFLAGEPGAPGSDEARFDCRPAALLATLGPATLAPIGPSTPISIC